MHLVEALAAGVRGAENGYAQIFVRGTTTRAAWYEDFEGETVDDSGADVWLDGQGRAVVYLNQFARVDVFDEGGTQVVSFVAGDATPNVEYQGSAFTGTNYESGATGAGSGYAVSLHTILQRALTSFGAADWKITVNGVATNLSTVLGSLAGIFYNVKAPAYGAVGDGVTDDTTAIQAAIDAAEDAGGGIVFFPKGSYSVTSELEWPASVSLLGAGAVGTIIGQAFNSGHLLSVVGGSVTSAPRIAAGFTLASAATNTDSTINLETDSLVRFSHCSITHLGTGGECLTADASATTRVYVDHCRFTVATTSTANMISSATSARITVTDSEFVTPLSYTPANAIVYGNSLTLERCTFTNSESTSGTINCVAFNNNGIGGKVLGCTFSAGNGATVTALVLGTYTSGSVFHESHNIFGTTVTAYSYTVNAASAGASVNLVTRETRYLAVTVTATPYTVPLDQYGVIAIESTFAGNVTLNGTAAPVGAHGTVWITNSDGSGRNFTPSGGSFLFTAAKAIGAAGANAMVCDVTIGDGVLYILNVWVQ